MTKKDIFCFIRFWRWKIFTLSNFKCNFSLKRKEKNWGLYQPGSLLSSKVYKKPWKISSRALLSSSPMQPFLSWLYALRKTPPISTMSSISPRSWHPHGQGDRGRMVPSANKNCAQKICFFNWALWYSNKIVVIQ